jgi:hypothetical protein
MRWEDTLNVLIALLKRNSGVKAAMSEIPLGFYPKSELIEKTITEFAKKVDLGGIVVIDDIPLIIGSYYKDDESRHLLIASIPYFLTLSDNFPSTSVLENSFEDRMIVQRFGRNFIFKQITLNRDSSPYYLLLLKDDLVFHKEDFETFAKKLKEILYKKEIMEWKKTIVLLSFFHRRIGPTIFYSYPQQKVGEEISDRLYDVMTQQKGEEYFMHSFEECKFLNYYFQIPSDWARGFREMIMISIIIYHQISPEIEESIASLCKNFAEEMQSNEDIFTGFYINEISKYNNADQERIKRNERLIKDGIKELYWETMKETRKKSGEPNRFRNLETFSQSFSQPPDAEILYIKRIDPELRGTIQAFLEWVKDPEGLAGYISYYLQQNNHQVISKLSKIYNELIKISLE